MTTIPAPPAGATFADVIAAISDAAERDRLREDYAMDRGSSVRGYLVATLVAAATDYDGRRLPQGQSMRRHLVARALSACDPAVAAGYAVTLVDLCDRYVKSMDAGDQVGRRAAYDLLSAVASRAARAQMDALRFLAAHYPDELWP